MGRVELVLAQYIRAVLGWQGLGAALPHYAQAGGDMQPLAEGERRGCSRDCLCKAGQHVGAELMAASCVGGSSNGTD